MPELVLALISVAIALPGAVLTAWHVGEARRPKPDPLEEAAAAQRAAITAADTARGSARAANTAELAEFDAEARRILDALPVPCVCSQVSTHEWDEHTQTYRQRWTVPEHFTACAKHWPATTGDAAPGHHRRPAAPGRPAPHPRRPRQRRTGTLRRRSVGAPRHRPRAVAVGRRRGPHDHQRPHRRASSHPRPASRTPDGDQAHARRGPLPCARRHHHLRGARRLHMRARPHARAPVQHARCPPRRLRLWRTMRTAPEVLPTPAGA